MDNNGNINTLFELLKEHKDKEFIEYLSNDDTLDINFRDNRGNYFITYAVKFNKKSILKLLLERNARYDVIDDKGRCLLYYSIESDFLEVTKMLIDYADKSIGVMLSDIRDYDGNNAIHYAISYRSIQTLKYILDSKSYNVHKLYIRNRDGYNALHTAVKSRSADIVRLVLNKMKNPNVKSKSGITALHMAIIYQYTDIAKILINNQNVIIDIADDDNKLTPLHYATGFNNHVIVESLLERDADINIQDIHGNTPIVYAVKEDHKQSFDILIKHSPNINTWNNEGKFALHEAFDKGEDIEFYIKHLLEDTNLSHQDSYGNTILHYLIANNLWKDYIKVLERKKLNIFASNADSDMPINMLNSNDDIQLLLDTTAKSYVHVLKEYGNDKSMCDSIDECNDSKCEIIRDEFHKICSRNLTDISKKDMELLKDKYGDVKGTLNVCEGIARNKIVEILDRIRKGDMSNYKSYPSKNIKIDIEYPVVDMCTFTGNHLDVLIGLIFLMNKHNNCCTTISYTSNMTSNNESLCNYYKSMGLIMSDRCEFFNFEIVWINYKLFIIDDFGMLFKNCIESDARFIIIPLGIVMKIGSHANYLIYDKVTQEMERFEPHGGTTPIGFNYKSDILDKLLEKYMKSVVPNLSYVRPEEYISKVGFQMMESHETNVNKIGDPEGFCALWSIWYVDQRLTYQNHNRKVLVDALFQAIQSKNIGYRNLIRNYSRNIIKMRDDILKSVGLNINDWMNERYDNMTHDKLMLKIKDEVNRCCTI
jgi:ankyrin repeat protein